MALPNRRKKDAIKHCTHIMDAAGFTMVSVENFHAPFDIIARKHSRTVIIKNVRNIDSVTKEDGHALSTLSYFFDAEVYIVGESYKGKDLEDHKVFKRHSIGCIDADSLQTVLYNGGLKYAKRFFNEEIEINGSELKRLRKLSGMSMKELSDISDVSVDSIYRYERGTGSASPKNLKKLEKVLDSKLASDSKITNFSIYEDAPATKTIHLLSINKEPFEKAFKGRHRFEFGEIADPRTLKKWALFYKKFNEVFDDTQFIITKGRKRESIFGIPTINGSKLSKLTDEEELYELAEEK